MSAGGPPRTPEALAPHRAAFEEARRAILAAPAPPPQKERALRQLRNDWTAGRESVVSRWFTTLPEAPAAERPALGRLWGGLKAEVERRIEADLADLAAAPPEAPAPAGGTAPAPTAGSDLFDPTLPGTRQRPGALHPITLVVEEVSRVFGTLGFEVVTGPEVEDEAHNFDGLNIPPGHPARDPSENLRLRGGGLLRSQTSPVQVRTLEETVRRHGPRPVRVIAPGRVYRPDTVDARHLYAFHQVEGLCVGEGVSFADLKGTLAAFAEAFYGTGAKTRFRPSYFPFTEPSAEMDVSCPRCGGHGIPGPAPGGPPVGSLPTTPCPVCGGEGWMELLGCGMVHPGVLERAGYDPERWTGFAFGMGIERAAMRRWEIHDIRWLVENDVRFLGQFA